MNLKPLAGLLLAGCFLLAGCTKQPPKETAAPVQVQAASTIYLPSPADSRLPLAVKQNKDTVAWLTVPGTSIDAPVQQSTDNDQYLRRDALGASSFTGCYFADYECSISTADTLSRNTIIYGHTFADKQGQFFDELHAYTQNESWAKDHRIIELSTPDAKLTFEVISAAVVEAEESSLLIKANLTKAEQQTLIDDALNRSVFDFGANAADCSRLLTLSTCTGDADTRLVVVARLVTLL